MSRFSEFFFTKVYKSIKKLYVSCVYAEVNQQFQCLVYAKCFSWNTFQLYVHFQAVNTSFPKQKLKKKFYVKQKGI